MYIGLGRHYLPYLHGDGVCIPVVVARGATEQDQPGDGIMAFARTYLVQYTAGGDHVVTLWWVVVLRDQAQVEPA